MSLRIWLPLNGDLNNQGYDQGLIKNVGGTIDNNGKIGSCYYLNSTSRIYSHLFTPKSNNFSICCWYKATPEDETSGYLFGISRASSASYLLYKAGLTQFRIYINGQTTYTHNIDLTKWHHLTLTYDGSVSSLYIDGVYKAKRTQTVDYTTAQYRLFINCRSNNSNTNGAGNVYGGNNYYNDVRFYDKCLSPLEIKEISQGLVLHYKFDNVQNQNLIKNGYGNMETLNLGNTSKVSDDVPDVPGVMQSFLGAQNFSEKIPIYQDHEYYLEGYFKSNATSGTHYPSISVYDVDGNSISYQQVEGFSDATLTTVTQEINKNDTVLHFADLSEWPDSGYIAFFNYTDGTGYTYPELTYTRNLVSYSGATVDRTANTITLATAYNGVKIPSGTPACKTKTGSTYFYPLGSMAKKNLTSWTKKSAKFIPKNNKRTKYAKTITYRVYAADVYDAGIKLIDLTNNNKIADSSGYNNTGIQFGTIEAVTGAACYERCIYIPSGNTDYITTTNEVGNFSEGITMSIWFKSINTSPGSGYHILFNHATQSQDFEFSVPTSGHFRGGMKINNTRYVDETDNNILDGQWHMLTMTYDGQTIRRYVDGIDKKDTTIAGTPTSTSCQFLFGHYGPTTTYYAKEAYLNDARVYCTALTEEDIQNLYKIHMFMDNKNNMLPKELNEEKLSQLNKQGILYNNIIEPFITLPDGSKWQLILFHKVDNGTRVFTSDNATYCNEYGLFSRLAYINDFTYNDQYEFYVIQDGTEFRWVQTSQPTAASITEKTVVEGYNDPVNGLAKANQSYTYIGYNAWWGACGSYRSYTLDGKTGIPGFGPHTSAGICTDYLALYARIEEPHIFIEESSAQAEEFIER